MHASTDECVNLYMMCPSSLNLALRTYVRLASPEKGYAKLAWC